MFGERVWKSFKQESFVPIPSQPRVSEASVLGPCERSGESYRVGGRSTAPTTPDREGMTSLADNSVSSTHGNPNEAPNNPAIMRARLLNEHHCC